MNWPETRKLIDAKASIESLLKVPDFLTSKETVFIQAAATLRNRGRLTDAKRLIRRLLKKRIVVSRKTETILKHLLADCLLDELRFAEAVLTYNSILEKSKDATAYANRGLAYWELRQYEQALNDYLMAVSLSPRDMVAHRSAGELSNRLGHYSKAVEHLNKALKLDPDCSRTFSALGISYYNLKDWLKAYRALRKAVELDPTNQIARRGLRKLENHLK